MLRPHCASNKVPFGSFNRIWNPVFEWPSCLFYLSTTFFTFLHSQVIENSLMILRRHCLKMCALNPFVLLHSISPLTLPWYIEFVTSINILDAVRWHWHVVAYKLVCLSSNGWSKPLCFDINTWIRFKKRRWAVLCKSPKESSKQTRRVIHFVFTFISIAIGSIQRCNKHK